MLWPPYRTGDYVVWAACIAAGVRPPGCKERWEDCSVHTQARLIGFYQTREHVRTEEMQAMAKAGAARMG